MKLFNLLSLVAVANASTSTSSSSAKCPFHHSPAPGGAIESLVEAVPNMVRKAKGNDYAVPSRIPGIKEVLSQKMQIRALTKPKGFIAKRLQPILTLMEGFKAMDPYYLSWKRMAFGENFIAAGQVVLGEWDEVVKAITSPQARTCRLGTTLLDDRHLPTEKLVFGPDRDLFVLALSQKGAGGDGTYETLRSTIDRHIIMSPDVWKRRDDVIARKLMDQLAEDYDTMKEKDFFYGGRKDHGFECFMIKYIHYCLFGLNPFDTKSMGILQDFYFTNTATLWYMRTVGSILNIKGKFTLSKLLRQVINIYVNSSALAAFPDNEKISRFELAHAITPIMAIAALVGPGHLMRSAMGADPLPEYKDKPGTSKIDVKDIWAKINLKDDAEVDRFIYEVGRLWNPVGHTHRTATEEFTVKVLGKERTFPEGTVISIPINMCMSNTNIWGSTTFEFDHNRKDLIEKSMIFHSVGNKNAGRMCPGKSFAMKMMREVIQRCGEVHQKKAQSA